MEQIMNLPEYAINYPYIVVSEVDGDFWFYGAYATWEKANTAAQMMDGYIIAK